MVFPHEKRRIEKAIVFSGLLHLLLISFLTIPLSDSKKEVSELEVILQGREIVDISPPDREEKPKEAHFLGLYDSRTDREKVALSERVPPSRRRVVEGPDGRELSKGEGMRYAMKSPPEGVTPQSVLPEEYFPDIEVGEKTYLNVLRFPKISYFVRLKKIFNLTWDPEAVLDRYFFAGGIERKVITTTLTFEIDREGNLRQLRLHQSSGLPLYDQEALRVVEASAPFAAPPEHLLDDDGADDGALSLTYIFRTHIL